MEGRKEREREGIGRKAERKKKEERKKGSEGGREGRNDHLFLIIFGILVMFKKFWGYLYESVVLGLFFPAPVKLLSYK